MGHMADWKLYEYMSMLMLFCIFWNLAVIFFSSYTNNDVEDGLAHPDFTIACDSYTISSGNEVERHWWE